MAQSCGAGRDARCCGRLSVVRHALVRCDTWLRGPEEDVQDLVQETLISVHTRRASYDRNRPFTAWLYAVARYRMVDHYRRRKVSVPIEDVDDLLVAEGFGEAVSARLDIDNLLNTLSPKQARAIRDTHINGKSVA